MRAFTPHCLSLCDRGSHVPHTPSRCASHIARAPSLSSFQSMTVIRIAWQGQSPDHKVAAVGHRNAGLDAKLIALVRLTFTDALHLRCVQTVKLFGAILFFWVSSLFAIANSPAKICCSRSSSLIFRSMPLTTRPRKVYSFQIWQHIRRLCRACAQ